MNGRVFIAAGPVHAETLREGDIVQAPDGQWRRVLNVYRDMAGVLADWAPPGYQGNPSIPGIDPAAAEALRRGADVFGRQPGEYVLVRFGYYEARTVTALSLWQPWYRYALVTVQTRPAAGGTPLQAARNIAAAFRQARRNPPAPPAVLHTATPQEFIAAVAGHELTTDDLPGAAATLNRIIRTARLLVDTGTTPMTSRQQHTSAAAEVKDNSSWADTKPVNELDNAHPRR